MAGEGDTAARELTCTVCSYCGVGCGIVVQTSRPDGGSPVIAKVSGDKLHPTNFGRLCTKGATHAEMMLGTGRLESAHRRSQRSRALEPVPIDEAIRDVAARLRAIVDEHGPDAVALYVSGQMSIEAQYLATKLAKGYLRTRHIESNSRLCMASAGTGYKQSLGADGPPGSYTDFDTADLFFVIGANMADCHPILFLRMSDRLKTGAKLIVVDPRRNTTADRADLYLPIRPGTDLALLNGILHLLIADGHIDEQFIAEHTQGWEAMPEFLADYLPENVARITDLPEEDIRTAARWIGEAGNWMSCWTMGLNQSTHGTWNTNAICNLHLATGAICRPGSGPMSLTGQPNAMGGREMGYMGAGLPGQRSVLSPADREFVEQQWGLAPGTIRTDVGPGTVEMFHQMVDGTIKACWIICTNPVASMANRRTVIDGLEAAELVITQDTYLETATNSYADVVLPATLWAESDAVMINSERNLTLLQQSIPPAGDARPDWWLIAEVATEMGFGEAFTYDSSEQIFDEICQFWNPLTGWDFRGASYERLRQTPLQWPCPPLDAPGGTDDRHPLRYLNDGVSQSLYVDDDGHRPRLAFPTPTRRAVFHPRPHLDPAEMPDDDFPFVLNTGRLQHQWHTLTKTGKVAKLNKLNPGPFVEVHPDDAAVLQMADGASVEIVSRRGRAVLPAVVTDRVRQGTCFAPFHWNDEHGEYLTINAVTNDAVDPVSLQPEFKVCAVTLRPVAAPVTPVDTARTSAPVMAEPVTPRSGDTTSGAIPVHPLAALLDLGTLVPAGPKASEQAYLGGFLAALQVAPVTSVPVLPRSAPVGYGTRLWFDGMLAGLYSREPGTSVVAPAAPPIAPAAPGRTVLVLWASQTGNAESFASSALDGLTEAGVVTELVEMDECGLDRLAAATDILVITSTFGDGGPPDDAGDFWAELSAVDAPDLTGTRFSVIGYGDSSYDEFCGFAAKVDSRLAELGATRLLERVSTEPDDAESQPKWLTTITSLLGSPVGPTGPVTTIPRQQQVDRRVESPPAPAFTRSNPINAVLVRNEILTGPDSAKEVRQFGFDLLDAPVTYQVGDALGIFAANSPETVQRWLEMTGLNGDVNATAGDDRGPLRELLRTHYDITKVTPELLRFAAARNPDETLVKLLRQDNEVELNGWLWGRHAIDLLEAHAVTADLFEWQAVLKKLQPRQYSISSSPKVDPREIQLTVSVLRYDSPRGQVRGGLCSTFLADRASTAPIPIYLQASPHFRPPKDPSTPMMMIGPGTGVAPFRAFLHDRRAAGATGRNWLFFGDQHATENFYYRSELEQFFGEGLLTRLDLAFSRDQRQRIYVQDRMLEHGAELWRWIQDGAAVYVCGDATRMAKDVDATLLTVARTHGHLSEVQAAEFRKQLIKDGRYHRDVY
ncbi:NADPH-dependent sulfite reductase flavoprotein alpha-component [Nakamurella sp. UYEF19]|uniref:bifunctional nitrate reductase/sulfite reductase flavoprotein subunit alpha n=1 Tax=Nakamurella sp. UYEF19 TaxID=1756392 RepID=UPI003396E198